MKKLITFTKEILEKEHLSVLREIGRQVGVKAPAEKNKVEIIRCILDVQSGKVAPIEANKRGARPKLSVDISNYLAPETQTYYEKEADKNIILSDNNGIYEAEGVLEIIDKYGFLRAKNYENSDSDVFIHSSIIAKFNLRRGDVIKAVVKLDPAKEKPAVQTVLTINGKDVGLCVNRKYFDDLTPDYPTERIKLETKENDVSLRCIDLFSPIGMGQRGLIVAPPKTGKTTLLKKIAVAIEQNHPEIKLIVLLIDERPEEVTDMKRSVKSEVVFSTFDEGARHHVQVAELVIDRAKRLVENGQNVVILMDSITRLVRAYNQEVDSSGKVLTGGIDPVALHSAKRIFGAARNIENGGSLTILSTALVETGSRMDDVIYEEFKGTGNMEIHLSRALAEKRVFPAIDIIKSGTRKDDLLLSEEELSTAAKLRRILSDRSDATDGILGTIKKTKNNSDLSGKVDAFIKLYTK